MATRNTLLSLFNHVVLPPELPGEADGQAGAVEKEMILRLLAVVNILKAKCEEDLFPIWQMIENTLSASSFVNEGGICNGPALFKVLKKLISEAAILVQIKEQNAALVIRKKYAFAGLLTKSPLTVKEGIC